MAFMVNKNFDHPPLQTIRMLENLNILLQMLQRLKILNYYIEVLESLLGLVLSTPIVSGRNKFPYLENASTELVCGGEVRYPSRLVPGGEKRGLKNSVSYECLELDELWKVTKSVLVDEAKKVCGVNKRTNVSKKDNEWSNFEVRKVVSENVKNVKKGQKEFREGIYCATLTAGDAGARPGNKSKWRRYIDVLLFMARHVRGRPPARSAHRIKT
ncbi:hypothetical protein EVAR_16991_1 [Eumeta japonica]|uniref:Uncharacterized protein n=1 Tax=Eumeta variegata TaxID=151549 RepID=A0A4C1TVI6_EUMVA|nr:hypothetical protein EVAR_16991_1 [Eumeta japonica]